MSLIEILFPLGWQHYLLGGLTIGAGVALLYLFNGWVGGMSTVFSSSWSWVSKRPFFQQDRFLNSRHWRVVYALGVVLGALVWRYALADGQAQHTSVPLLANSDAQALHVPARSGSASLMAGPSRRRAAPRPCRPRSRPSPRRSRRP